MCSIEETCNKSRPSRKHFALYFADQFFINTQMTNIKHKVIYISCVMYEFCKKTYPNVRRTSFGVQGSALPQQEKDCGKREHK